MAQRAAGTGSGRRGRSSRIGTSTLVAVAVAVAAVCMITLTTKAVIGRASCTNTPVLANVVASDDIAPAVQVVANAFNNQNATVGEHCVQVQVDEADSASEAAQIDGQAARQGAVVDAWIPDSSLWVDVARTYPVGAQVIQPTGKSVALSPLMLVTTRAVATETGVFTAPPSWGLLLPSAYGGPPASEGISVDLPDPTTSATGLASLIQVSRQLGTGAAARTAVTDFALGVQSTENFDSPTALAQFVATTQPPFDRRAITVATEQAVLAYDKTTPNAPLDAVYATGADQALGTPELDYPYVLTTSQAAPLQAAAKFGTYLQTAYAQSVLRAYGFRSATGQADVMPRSTGLSGQPLQLAGAASPTEAAANLQVWQRLGLGFRDLVLTDVSPAMNQPSGLGTLTLEQLLAQTASQGLGLFPDGTEMGVWDIGESSSATQPYTQVVPIGLLSGNVGVLSRRAQIEQIDATATTSADGALALNNAILAAYQKMTESYAPQYVNAVIVLTAGVDSAPGDISTSALLAQLQKLYNASRKVEVIILMFGSQGNFAALQQVAAATGGAAFQVTNPSEIGQVFVEAVAQRVAP
ncbi:MAG TPA: substrate-binding and VWA domain-containing protein [Streptosporangiaceae bacterium]|nr:substrate-binding and VWA domain-containing protein [Streptosporangiaceae bacterium]